MDKNLNIYNILLFNYFSWNLSITAWKKNPLIEKSFIIPKNLCAIFEIIKRKQQIFGAFRNMQ